jgi:hypothetical protein
VANCSIAELINGKPSSQKRPQPIRRHTHAQIKTQPLAKRENNP